MNTAPPYEELKKFQEYRKQLDTVCHQLFQIIQDGTNRGVVSHTLAEDVRKVSHKLQSQRFRVAVVGDFSQGKSTLINALVREEIQPVRAIACNGTVTVLKHGLQKQIVCEYKDGSQENISFEQYQVLATISKEAARKYRSDELARSKIEEIIFEHPDLDLCKNGVEIVDSPGLNEHPDRAAVTQKLLKNADAVIFITDASRALTQGERNLIQDLKTQLNAGKENESATNLFIVVNKMDQLGSEEDWQDVQELVEEFAYGQNSVIAGKQRIHFISAKAAMQAFIAKTENDYLKSFQTFAESVEKFLTSERGSVEIKQSATKLEQIVQNNLSILQQTEAEWDGKIKDSELGKQKIVEEIGELSGHDVRIRLLLKSWMKELKFHLAKEVKESWDEWIKIKGLLEYHLYTKAEHWYTDHDPVWNQHGIVDIYTKLFIKNLSDEINIWVNKNFTESLRHKLETLDIKISSELKTIAQGLYASGQSTQSFKAKTSFNFEVSQKGLYGDLWRWITCILFVGYFFGSADQIKSQMKEKVIQECLTQFRKLSSNVLENEDIDKTISSAFESRFKFVDEIIERIILSYKARLEQQDIEYRKILEEYEAEKAWSAQKRQELEQVQNNIEAIINRCAG